jgi:hypothetical protein
MMQLVMRRALSLFVLHNVELTWQSIMLSRISLFLLRDGVLYLPNELPFLSDKRRPSLTSQLKIRRSVSVGYQ